MTNIIEKHPGLLYASDMIDICRPLQQLKITYFAHVHVSNKNQFSALTNNPKFTKHYLQNKYFNADIHMAGKKLGSYVMWDSIERVGESAKMHKEAADFGVQHTFTIIENTKNGSDFYHFANNENEKTINQIYLSNIDFLKLFIVNFKTKIFQSKELASAYDFTFKIDQNADGYTIKEDSTIIKLDEMRTNGFNRIYPNINKEFN